VEVVEVEAAVPVTAEATGAVGHPMDTAAAAGAFSVVAPGATHGEEGMPVVINPKSHIFYRPESVTYLCQSQ
jgi:hypothetical protein